MVDRQRSPEKFLKRARVLENQTFKGKLKIYIGAAPGVGKTYEMLHDALDKKAHGFDVVIGIVESHERKDIDLLVKKFEILPKQRVVYRDSKHLEFDLDAALKRHPGLILVDEMAHTNIPGLRHAKRWQDIKELLERGIDVYTTLNVQHIESIKDDVAQIIHAPVHETVPDSMLEQADVIELIDLPPEDLLQRLQEGKVYFPNQAQIAKEHFFRMGNLIALRELALRVTAKHVNTEVLWYRQGEGIKEIWPVKEKILVCVGPKPEALNLIRAAKRLASSLSVEWLAVYVDTPRQGVVDARNKAIKHLQFAELLGAETHVLSGFDVVQEIMHFAREQNVTQIMVWKHILMRFRDWFRRNLADEIVRYSGEIDVYIISGELHHAHSQKKKIKKTIPWKIYGIALSLVTGITLLNTVLFPLLAPSNLIMIYLLGVTCVALFGKTGPSILASILSVIAYDFFFIPPRFSFAITDVEYFLTLLIMLIVSQVISQSTILIRNQAQSARVNQRHTAALYTFNKKISAIRGINQIIQAGTELIAGIFNSQVIILLGQQNGLKIRASVPLNLDLNDKEQGIAQWVYDTKLPAGIGTDTLASSEALYLPIIGPSQIQGVLRIKSQQLLSPEERFFLKAYVNQIAIALEIERLDEKTRKKELEFEKDKAQIRLLTFIYHDLCFPFSRVIKELTDAGHIQDELLNKKINHEMDTLNRLTKNLYHMIQLETQEIALNKTLVSLEKIIQSAIRMARKILEKRPIETHLKDNLPLIYLDKKLIQEVIFHLLDNAIKFSTPNSIIKISVEEMAKKLIINIENEGLAIIPAEKKKLFKKFYRGKEAPKSGLGLGLAICDKIIKAHLGTIWFENINNKGTLVSFSLPIED